MTATQTSESPFLRGLQELAGYLNCSTKTVYRLTRSHRIPVVKLGGVVLYRKADVEEALNRATIPAVGMNKRTAKRGA